MTTAARTAFRLATLAALAEALLVIGWTLRHAPEGAPLYAGILWAGMKAGPLMLVLPWLLRGSHRAATCLAFLLCVYFMGAVWQAFAPPPERWLGLFECALVTGGFVASLLATRWRRQELASGTNLAPPD